MRFPGSMDVCGRTVPGRDARTRRAEFAIASIDKSLHVRSSSLPEAEDARLRRRTQGHVLVIAEDLGGAKEPTSSTRAGSLGGIVRYLLDELPWSHFAEGESSEVTGAMKEAIGEASAELWTSETWTRGTASARTDEAADGAASIGTLVLAFVVWPHLYLAHTGGGQVGLLRDGHLQHLARNRSAPSARAIPSTALHATGPPAPRTTRCAWPTGTLPRARHLILRPSDTIVLASGGAAPALDDPSLQRRAVTNESAVESCRELLAPPSATDRAVVVARFGAAAPPEVAPDRPRGWRRASPTGPDRPARRRRGRRRRS